MTGLSALGLLYPTPSLSQFSWKQTSETNPGSLGWKSNELLGQRFGNREGEKSCSGSTGDAAHTDIHTILSQRRNRGKCCNFPKADSENHLCLTRWFHQFAFTANSMHRTISDHRMAWVGGALRDHFQIQQYLPPIFTVKSSATMQFRAARSLCTNFLAFR